jgi:hypothetical protein
LKNSALFMLSRACAASSASSNSMNANPRFFSLYMSLIKEISLRTMTMSSGNRLRSLSLNRSQTLSLFCLLRLSVAFKNILNTSLKKIGRPNKLIVIIVIIVLILLCDCLVVSRQELGRPIFLEGVFGLI